MKAYENIAKQYDNVGQCRQHIANQGRNIYIYARELVIADDIKYVNPLQKRLLFFLFEWFKLKAFVAYNPS